MRKSASIVVFILFMCVYVLRAQQGAKFSSSYDFYPHRQLSNPDTSGGQAFLQDGEIRVGTFNFNASYPYVFSEGKTVLVSEFNYQRFDIDYKKFPVNTNPEHVYAFAYNLMVMHTLSERWSLLGFLTPGLASDFEADVSGDDFTLQVVAVFIRNHSERLQVGYGAAWTNTFGQPFPVPILAIEWNNGKNMKLSTILPANFEFWYRANQRFDLGLALNVDGNQYHGDPDIYNVDVPLMRYSVGTFGPSVKYNIAKGLSLGIDSGITFLRRFEFFDGNNEDNEFEYKLKNTGFVRINFQFGG